MNNDALYAAAMAGNADAISELEAKADKLDRSDRTILHNESGNGNTERVRFLVNKLANKNILLKLDGMKQTALHFGACYGHTQVVEVLIDAATHLPSSSSNRVSSFQAFIRQVNADGATALSNAVNKDYMDIVKLLVEADPGDCHIQNGEGKTPIYVAAEKGYNGIVKLICATCTNLSLDGPDGSTALHAAILNFHKAKEEDRDVMTVIINAAKRSSSSHFEALFNRTDESGCTVLELAVKKNYVNMVKLILAEDPACQRGRVPEKHALMCLIYKAIDTGYKDIVKLLCRTYEAGITTGHRGVVYVILAIKRCDKASVLRLLIDNIHFVTFFDDEGWTLLHYAAYHEFVSIFDVLVEVQKYAGGHQFSYEHRVSTPLHVAAENGYTSTLIRLMQLFPSSSSAYTAINKNGQNILHLAATRNKKDMIQGILKHCPEKYKDKILKQVDDDFNTTLHLLISHGCFVPELIKHKGLDTLAKNKENWSPRDMLYHQDEIIADQVQIKIALDDVQTGMSWKFWGKRMKKNTDILESLVPPSKREIKDIIFNKHKKLLMDENSLRMKKDSERYRKRTNTQIIVTALITTVTFTVGFTMPGGLHQSGEVDEGLVLLSKKTAFNAFMVSDALALLLSTCSLFLYFVESIYEDPHQVSKLNAAAVGLNIVSIIAMMLTFITGTYVVLSQSLALAIIVCLIGSFFFLFVIVLLIKIVYDRQVKKNKD